MSVNNVNENEKYEDVERLRSNIRMQTIKECYIRKEIKNLQRQYAYCINEVNKLQSVPLVIGQFVQAIDNESAIVLAEYDRQCYVPILSTLNKEMLSPNATIALHKSSQALVDIMAPESESSIRILRDHEKPDVTFAMIGGLDSQKQEMREAIELPLTHPELYRQVGIDAPRGVLMYGPPGSGKTMLAKAVANETKASFIRVNGSEFVQKYLGEGPKMVRDIFRLAKLNAPSIIFIDEVDAIATKRFDTNTGADREVQRILIELLTQMDGFDQSVNVKVIMATNRADTLDPALLRPGRLDRKIKFPLPDKRQKRMIFSTVTSTMSLAAEVDIDEIASKVDDLSGAEIHSVCQEAGMQAVRDNRYVVMNKDFEKAFKSVCKKEEQLPEFYN